MNEISFIEVTTGELIQNVVALAKHIWCEHYTPLIGEAQVSYMLANIQSPEAIQNQITKRQYHYYLFQDKEGAFIGYLGFTLSGKDVFLSKIYLTLESRGHGYARDAMMFLEGIAGKQNCTKITLTVNKGNLNAIGAYEKMGFLKVDSIVQDIGNGFVMDDSKMEKLLSV